MIEKVNLYYNNYKKIKEYICIYIYIYIYIYICKTFNFANSTHN